MKDGGAECLCLVSVSNIPKINPKSLHSAFVVKAYVLKEVFVGELRRIMDSYPADSSVIIGTDANS